MSKNCVLNRENSLRKGINVRKGMVCTENYKRFGSVKIVTMKI